MAENDFTHLISFLFENWQILFLYIFKYLKDINSRFLELNERLLELEVIERERAKRYAKLA